MPSEVFATQALGRYEPPSIVDPADEDRTIAPVVSQPLDDPFDMPTRNDPNLRKLVERELELQKARKRGK